ncbi:hypothetical protein [Campylobacter ureolyticus]|uniref:hypothetical protein n=1 Tax=Campylobacter ureolyticus TaxID=827 RepID=UPI0022B3B767|nr:hypothetical protein [Campylobacter ureolyticus]MCZ6173247.1 hypothetical protein [Campylobacter ureolyticus]MDK8323178.1 hypothetical protein [Campylobacter ureolyticus]
MQNKTSRLLQESGEIPLFYIKDYNRKFFISSALLMSLFSIIYFFGHYTDSVFHIKTFYSAISCLICIVLFGCRTSNNYFFENMLKYNIGDFRISYKVSRPSDISKILLIKNTRVFISSIYDDTMHKSDRKLYILILYMICFFDLIFSIIFKILNIFKSIKTDLLVLIDNDGKNLIIHISELTDIEFYNLDNYMEEKFNLKISEVDKYNLKGELIC